METNVPKSMIAGVQSVMPVEVTQHRKVRPVSVSDPLRVGIFRRTLNIVTYNKLASDRCERGWLVAGWIKESLGRALKEQPMLSGRLRRKEGGGLEVVANDGGVRLVEARFPTSLSEFLEMVKRDKCRAQGEIVFWRDIDEVDPHFSPLFYVQVTNFESGGYSIGMSCSILIADLLLETGFLRKWAKIQTSLANTKTTLKPIFYLPSLKKNDGNFIIDHPRSSSILDAGKPIAFRVKKCPKMSLACIKRTVKNREKASVDVFLFTQEHCDGENSTDQWDFTKVEISSRDDAELTSNCGCGCDLEEDALNVSLAFEERLEDTSTSCWVGSISKGVVFVVPSTFGDKSLAKFIVAFPKE